MFHKFEQAGKLLESQNIPYTPIRTPERVGGFDFDEPRIEVAGFVLTAGQIVKLYEEGPLNLQGIAAFAERTGLKANPVSRLSDVR